MVNEGVGPEWIANLILVSTIFLTIGTSFKFVDFWWCYRWTITTDQIKLNSGVINKKGQAYNLKDVKAVLVTQTVFERMVDLYTLAIDFPQLSGRDKFKIVGLTAKQLQPLQQALNGGEPLSSPDSMDSASAAPVVNIPTFKLTPPLICQSVWMAPPVLAVLSVLLALVGWLSDIGVKRLHIRLGFTTIDMALYLLSILLLCVVVRVFEYGNFKVERHANYLTLSNGFLALQTKQIPLKQLQNIVVSQNVLERLLGYGSVAVTVLGDNQRQAGVKGTTFYQISWFAPNNQPIITWICRPGAECYNALLAITMGAGFSWIRTVNVLCIMVVCVANGLIIGGIVIL